MAYGDPFSHLGRNVTRVEHATKSHDGFKAKRSVSPLNKPPDEDHRKDHFIEEDGVRFAGRHLIIDLFGATRLDDLKHVERTLKRCVEVAGATLLHIHLHHFTPNGGVSGVAVLAESHISIHTWPEASYAALDVFMCGNAKPHRTVPVLEEAFAAQRVEVQEFRRGDNLDEPSWQSGAKHAPSQHLSSRATRNRFLVKL